MFVQPASSLTSSVPAGPNLIRVRPVVAPHIIRVYRTLRNCRFADCHDNPARFASSEKPLSEPCRTVSSTQNDNRK